jgi:predicted DNA-binding protein
MARDGLKNFHQVIAYLTPKQHAALKKLSALTGAPMSYYLREAVGDVLKKHRRKRRR